MKTPASLALLCAAALATPAQAQTQAQIEARYSGDYNRCMATGDAADGVDSAMAACTDAEIARQDARLNLAYKATLARLTPAQKPALVSSERGWIVRRDNQCDNTAAEFQGGTMAAVVRSGCVLDETIKRTMWLERYRP